MYISIVEDDGTFKYIEVTKGWDMERFNCVSKAYFKELTKEVIAPKDDVKLSLVSEKLHNIRK